MDALLRKSVTIIATTLCCIFCAAQRRYVVRDMETGTPLRGVTVIFNGIDSCRTATDYTGTFAAPDSVRTLVLSHPKYEKRIMERSEMTDTVELLPNINRLNEVVIRGKMRTISPKVFSDVKIAALTAPINKGTMTFDMMNLLTYRKRKKTQKRIKSIENF